MDFFSMLFAKALNPSGTSQSKIIEYSFEGDVIEDGPFSCEISIICKEAV